MRFILGLTGGIACGKSTVSQAFCERGAVLVDADLIARQVVQPGTDGLALIVENFGGELLDADGSLRRKALGAIVFADPEKLNLLNELLHPLIEAEVERQVASSRASVTVVDAALLLELGLDRLCDGVVVVWAPAATQVARIMARDGLDEASARARVAAQRSHQWRLHRATWEIDNSAGLHELAERVAQVWRAIEQQTAERGP